MRRPVGSRLLQGEGYTSEPLGEMTRGVARGVDSIVLGFGVYDGDDVEIFAHQDGQLILTAKSDEGGPLRVERLAERLADCPIDEIVARLQRYPRHELRSEGLVDCLGCPSPGDEALALSNASGFDSRSYEIRGQLDATPLWAAPIREGKQRELHLDAQHGELVVRFANKGAPTIGLDAYIRSTGLQATEALLDGVSVPLSRVADSVVHAGFPEARIPEGPGGYAIPPSVDATNPNAFIESEEELIELRIPFEASTTRPFQLEVTLAVPFAPPLGEAPQPLEDEPALRATRQTWRVIPPAG